MVVLVQDVKWYLAPGSCTESMRHFEHVCVLAGAVLSGIGITLMKFHGCNRQQPELSPLQSQGFLCRFQTSQARVR